MKLTIVTAVFNGANTIADCIKSVRSQTYQAEHIIIDGASFDNTLQVVERHSSDATIISEPDEGIYDAMNKGIRLASGDIIGILNSDDFYYDEFVLEKVLSVFINKKVDAVFADLVYVQPDNLGNVVRYYSAADFTPNKFAYGWMPPHPTFFVKRKIYEKYGLFKTDYKIAADFELLARLLVRHKVSYHYLPEVIVKMRTGGISTRSFKSNWILNKEIIRACRENNISTNFFKIYSKYFTKIFQLINKPS
ncbi:glycosyltransferase family 2 protein [Thermodesulfobacteriota bacterium]